MTKAESKIKLQDVDTQAFNTFFKSDESKLKFYRIMAHRQFDLLWKVGKFNRNGAYTVLRKLMNLPEQRAHIKLFDIEQCRTLIEKLETFNYD